ncbi:MAG: hypothetical protein LUC44_01625 [Prevotellaceae bacterium]|nr:hypothetical protein [Prevotellaceae bacterium]
MKRQIASLMAVLCLSIGAFAQKDPEPVEVQVYVGDSLYAIVRASTQTEAKTGWNVVSFSVGGKTTKYLWGRQSFQLLDERRPRFVVNPVGGTLSDYAIIRLKQKKTYRLLPEPLLRDNKYMSIDLVNFFVELTEDDKFIVRPQQELESGEYILLNINQEPHGDLGDYYGYPFTIE